MNIAPEPKSPQPDMDDPEPRRVPRCLAIDLEIGKQDDHIQALVGVRADHGESVSFPRTPLPHSLGRLDALAERAAFLMGHNILRFDLPRLGSEDRCHMDKH